MLPSARQILDLLKFVDLPPDKKKPGLTLHLCRDGLPDILIELGLDATATDVREAIYRAGAAMQRQVTREAWNRAADTFRSGQHVASADDILSLSELEVIIPQTPA